MNKKGQFDFEFNPMALGVAVLFCLLLAAMVFKLSMWDNYPMQYKVIMVVLGLPIFYFIADWRLK